MTIMQSAALRRWGARSLLVAAILIAAPAAYSEIGSDGPEDAGTLLGNYLSGRMARGDHNLEAAADYYSRALAEDPKNEMILEQAFLLEAASAHWDSAVRLAKELVKNDSTNRLARFLLGCAAFKQGRYEEADENFAEARQGPIADLTSTLARAWVQEASGKTKEALLTLDSLSDADWAQFYQRYHRALIADHAGKRDACQAAQALKNPSTRLKAHAVNAKTSRSIDIAKSDRPLSDRCLPRSRRLLSNTPTQPRRATARRCSPAKAARANIFRIAWLSRLSAAALARRGGELEIEALGQIKPDSPLWVNVQIQKALALNSLERVDEAKAQLEDLIAKHPKDVRPLDALGNILRSRERYAEAEAFYTKALALTPAPVKDNWALFYSRGVCNERLGLAGGGAGQEGARARADNPRAQLSRLFLGR
jgi:cytochrome c-type biogenesis protein CcmH/NrfG